jgi:hypothetical protein
MEQLLQHETEAAKTFGTYYCNICVKHMKQRLNKTLETTWNTTAAT